MSVQVGLQLYTLRKECAEDFVGTLRRVRRLGYRSVECVSTLFGASAAEVRSLLDEIDLRIPAVHLPLQELEGRLDAALDLWGPLGCRTVVCPWLDEATRRGEDAWERVGERLNLVGERARSAGFRLAYHNHDFELGSDNGLGRLLAATDPENLTLEIDVFWLHFAGIDPAAYLRERGSRVGLLHLKDGTRDPLSFRPLGDGEVDLPAVVAAASEAGVGELYVEQDMTDGPALAAVDKSYGYLEGLGLVGPA